jgi:hypothetical protein
MCTVAAHAVRRWQSTGGVLSSRVAPVAYPDERYLTRLMLWDEKNYAEAADADQLTALQVDSAQLLINQSPTTQLSPVAA